MYLLVKDVATKWNISERSVRNYCASGMIEGAFLVGKKWHIPDTATKPKRKNASSVCHNALLHALKQQMLTKVSGGIYHRVQIDLTYNSNHIEGSRLTHDETRYIFETNTVGIDGNVHNVDDIVETVNHFACIDAIIANANKPITEKFVKQLHALLKSGTSDSRKSWFNVGEYKQLPNEVGGSATCAPANVARQLSQLLNKYNAMTYVTFDDVLDFHYAFECIHPFQDGNGRVGRLLMFKQCLQHNIVPFIIDDKNKMFYYRGLKEWKNQQGYLRDTCLLAQDNFKRILQFFEIAY